MNNASLAIIVRTQAYVVIFSCDYAAPWMAPVLCIVLYCCGHKILELREQYLFDCRLMTSS